MRPSTRQPTGPFRPQESARLRAAVCQARNRYPGPVGEVLAHEINAWVEFGYRFGGYSTIERLVTFLLTAPKETADG